MQQKVVGVKIVVIFVCACIGIGTEVYGQTTKYFKYDTDVLNPENWDASERNCSGLWFAEENDASVYLDSLSVDQIVLPRRGPVTLIIGGDVVFKKATARTRCIKLKPMLYHDWDDFSNWRSDVENAAVPHLQRIPCDDDIAVLPKISFMRISTTRTSITLRAWRPHPEYALIKDWPAENLLNPLTSRPVRMFAIYNCAEDCECHKNYRPKCPEDGPPPPKPNCLQPIQPEDFCSPICGASITFKPLTRVQLHFLVSELTSYTSDTHVSFARDSFTQKIQVVFAEKHFQGQSLTDARDFYDKLRNSVEYKVEALKLTASGEYYDETARSGGGFTLVLGTFAGVVLIFALIFYLHDKNLEQFGVVSVLYRFGSSARTGFRDGFFARFDNTDENLIIENQSIAGSVLHLEKSFDNPMYQQGTTSADTDGNQHENPLFNVALNEE